MSTVDARAEKSLDLINRGLERKKIFSVRVEGKKKIENVFRLLLRRNIFVNHLF